MKIEPTLKLTISEVKSASSDNYASNAEAISSNWLATDSLWLWDCVSLVSGASGSANLEYLVDRAYGQLSYGFSNEPSQSAIVVIQSSSHIVNRINVFLPVFKSCKELSKCEHQDGEHYLQLQFLTCTKSVLVYCADMNTTQPKEYITLNSGEENNFSHLDNTMSPQEFNHYGSTTKFSKVSVT